MCKCVLQLRRFIILDIFGEPYLFSTVSSMFNSFVGFVDEGDVIEICEELEDVLLRY